MVVSDNIFHQKNIKKIEKSDSLMSARIHDDTWNALNMQHMA